MICDNDSCRTGCRMDNACGAGQICDNTLCRTGCRDDADCGSNAMCVQSTIKLTNSVAVKTFTITGNGSQTLYSDSYDCYCFMGMCAGWTHYVEVSSTSDSPVEVDLNFYVSATR